MPTFDPPPSPGSSPPTVTIAVNLTGTANRATSSVAYSLVFSSAVTGLEANDFTVTNGTINSVSGSGSAWTANVIPAMDVASGTIGLTLNSGAVSDAIGNLNARAANTSQTLDTLVPTAIFNPADEATGVAITSNIVLTFSEAITRGSGSIALKTAAGATIETYDVATSSANLNIAGTTLSINPTKDMGIFTGYQVEIAAGAIKDMAGNNYAGESNYNFTTQTLDSLYHFSVVAFSAAPGATFMGQMAEAYNAGMTVKQIVEVFSTKPQFTSTYADSMSNVDFATLLVANVVKDSASIATKTQAVNDIVSALTVWSRGETIYQIFGNLANMPLSNSDWGNTALQFNNQTAVARHFTEVMHNTTTDMPTLRAIVSSVTPTTDVSTPQAIATLIGIEVPGMH